MDERDKKIAQKWARSLTPERRMAILEALLDMEVEDTEINIETMIVLEDIALEDTEE